MTQIRSRTPKQLVDYYNTIYIKPYFRIGSYLVGILFAHFTYSHPNISKLSRKVVFTGWILSLSTLLVVAFVLYPAHQGNIPPTGFAAAYSAIARILWACSLAWITFASRQGIGGFFTRVLSFKVWVPLSRLTYCAYLVHPFVMAQFYGSQLQPFDYSFAIMVSFGILERLRILILLIFL